MASWVTGNLKICSGKQLRVPITTKQSDRPRDNSQRTASREEAASNTGQHLLYKSRARFRAEKHTLQGEIHAAIKQYRTILQHEPSDLSALNTLGDLWVRAGHLDEALSCFAQVAESYVKNRFNAKAIAMLKKILRIDPVRPHTALKLADLCLQEGLTAEAEQRFDQAARAFALTDQPHRAIEVQLRMAQLQQERGAVYTAIERRLEGIALAQSQTLWTRGNTQELERFEPHSYSTNPLQDSSPAPAADRPRQREFELVTADDRPRFAR